MQKYFKFLGSKIKSTGFPKNFRFFLAFPFVFFTPEIDFDRQTRWEERRFFFVNWGELSDQSTDRLIPGQSERTSPEKRSIVGDLKKLIFNAKTKEKLEKSNVEKKMCVLDFFLFSPFTEKNLSLTENYQKFDFISKSQKIQLIKDFFITILEKV